MQGYLTVIGENGIKLSGGQRQRLAIARSVVKRPSILILDEATSAIDVHSQKIVQAALDQVSQNRTTIIIAYRLSIVRKADHIIVMKEGRSIEEGSHHELMTIEDGMYRNLVNAQQLEAPSDSSVDVGGIRDIELRRDSNPHDTVIPSEAKGTSTQESKKISVPQGLGKVFYEQYRHWRLCILILICTIGAGCKIIAFIKRRLTNRKIAC